MRPTPPDRDPWWLILLSRRGDALEISVRLGLAGVYGIGWVIWHYTSVVAAAAFVVLGTVLAIEWKRRRRAAYLAFCRENRICIHCGYDLRATPQRCPECGSRVDEPLA